MHARNYSSRLTSQICRCPIAFGAGELVFLSILSVAFNAAQAQGLPQLPVSPPPTVQYEYDAEGNPTRSVIAPNTPSLNFSNRQAYDSLGRRISNTDAKNGVTLFGYDGQDRLTRVTDPRSLSTQYQRDGLGQTQALLSPDTGTATQTYDAAGNVKTRKDARGFLSTYSYDALGRMTGQLIAHPSNGTTRQFSWVYDQTGASFGYGIGRLTTASTPEAGSTFSYDALGRVVKESTVVSPAPKPLSVSYSYDAAGHVTSMSYPSGVVIDVEFANGQPQSIKLRANASAAQTPLLSNITVAPFGPVKSWQWELAAGPKLHERFFDDSGRMIRYALGGLIRDLRYDEADRITSYLHYDAASGASSPAFDQRFSYDALGRLTFTQLSNTSWSFAYDANGNRTFSSVGTSARAYSVASDSNRLNGLSNPQRSMGYDAAGNLVSDVSAGFGSNSFAAGYNHEGRLASMSPPGAQLDMAYDAQGRRVRRAFSLNDYTPPPPPDTSSAMSGVAIRSKAAQSGASGGSGQLFNFYAYDLQGHLLGEYDKNGAAVTEYIWLGDTPVAVLKPSAAGPSAPPDVYFVHSDHLDAPRVLIDQQGNLRWRWMAEPFGVNPAETSPSGLPDINIALRLPGQQFDAATGLHYNMYRDYDPTVGRYVQSDPIGLAGGINTYSYVGGNPLSMVDPYGLFGMDDVYGAIYSATGGWSPSQGTVDFSAGLGDALLLGTGGMLRDAAGVDGGVDRCTDAYQYGSYAALAAGGARVAYAGLAKAGSVLAASGAEASAFRSGLKTFFRGGVGRNWRPPNLAGKTDAQLRASAGKTNVGVNAYGAGVGAAGGMGSAQCGCPK